MNHYDNVTYKVYYKKAKMCILRQKKGNSSIYAWDDFIKESGMAFNSIICKLTVSIYDEEFDKDTRTIIFC